MGSELPGFDMNIQWLWVKQIMNVSSHMDYRFEGEVVNFSFIVNVWMRIYKRLNSLKRVTTSGQLQVISELECMILRFCWTAINREMCSKFIHIVRLSIIITSCNTFRNMNRLSLRNNRLKFRDIRRITDHFRGICRIYLKSVKKNQKITTCNWLDLETLGFWLIMPRRLNYSKFASWVHNKHSTGGKLLSPTWSNARYNSRIENERRHRVIHKHFAHHIKRKIHVTVLQVIC